MHPYLKTARRWLPNEDRSTRPRCVNGLFLVDPSLLRPTKLVFERAGGKLANPTETAAYFRDLKNSAPGVQRGTWPAPRSCSAGCSWLLGLGHRGRIAAGAGHRDHADRVI